MNHFIGNPRMDFPTPIQELFKEKDNGNWVIPKVRTENNGKETLRYRGPVTWNLLPSDIKEINTFKPFKEKVVKWKPQKCTCRLCKTYIWNLGYAARNKLFEWKYV